MKPEKDIGEFIKSRIDETKITPDDQVWGKINATLDKKAKKRKFLYLIPLLIALPMIGFVWLIVPSSQPSMKLPIDGETLVEKSIPINSTRKEDDFNTLEKDNDSETFGSELSSENSDEKERTRGADGFKSDERQNALISNTNKAKAKPQSSLRETSKAISGEDSINKTESLPINTHHAKPQELLIGESDTTTVASDSLSIALIEKKKKRSKEKKKKDSSVSTEKSKYKLWGVGLLAAGDYFNSFSRGSMLDRRLNDNRTNGKIHFQYGVSLHAKLSEQFEISYGASIVKFGYTTFLEDPTDAMNLSAVYTDSPSQQTQFVNNASSIEINQEFSYVELPLQFTYSSIIKDRIGFEGLLGMSTFILIENHVDLIDENGQTMRLGEANNLSKWNFSFNAGLGPYYEFSDRLKFRLIPMLKYHIKPLSKNNYERQTNFSMGLHGTLTYYFNL